ncbi:hypothetical protein HZA97_08020 [Candidatus Woesearchaeota archaeon]|nr:hypothetical protein [Candidatus Woesearchaeota archaeon]
MINQDFLSNVKILQPIIKPIFCDGKLIYSEKHRSRCIIILKRNLREEFSSLSGQYSMIKYRLECFRNDYKLFKQRVDDILVKKKGIPILLYLYEEENAANTPKEN